MGVVEQKIKTILNGIIRDVDGIEGVLLVDNNGFVLASSGAISQGHLDLIGGILTSLANVAIRVGKELNTGGIEGLIVEGREKQIYMRKIGELKTLIIVSRKETPMGMVTYMARKVAPAIDKIL